MNPNDTFGLLPPIDGYHRRVAPAKWSAVWRCWEA